MKRVIDRLNKDMLFLTASPHDFIACNSERFRSCRCSSGFYATCTRKQFGLCLPYGETSPLWLGYQAGNELHPYFKGALRFLFPSGRRFPTDLARFLRFLTGRAFKASVQAPVQAPVKVGRIKTRDTIMNDLETCLDIMAGRLD